MQVLSFSSPKLSTRNIVYMAMLMAMQIVLGRFSFGTPWLKISPAFFATILMGYYFGPWLAAGAAALNDQLSIMVFNPGANFPGFTFSAAIAAMIYGMFFHGKKVTVMRTLLGVGLVLLISNVILTTLWLNMMGTPWQGIIWPRTIKNVVMLPIQTALSYGTLKAVERIRPHL
ncbi:folate transporter [Lacticaseibacillus casei]|uniref:Folate family ECF transporter S component n=2 Tax=Lacticaseibacillus zeae TaxID=57037 RepID=A0A5R8LXX7_LACZE|nr:MULTISPECIES: folate family ECF transporter S component [Lacticaseibacillus]MDE3283190.1 folate family ECF transporter S component [Lacticaseibacillus casei]OLS08168.1 folate transporter [Lacticaseibacillus casei]QVI31353.1 folate family ECF transporter S component [Lacticaseibacillus zeae]TLF42123.1 folate family ECF transporter S component [Lacticaseibacillus zeae]